jgi:hypothetical protein
LRMWAPMINLPKSSPSHLMRKGFASYEMNWTYLTFQICVNAPPLYNMPLLRAK